MPLVTVNQLPDALTVSRQDIYHWYQVTEEIANPDPPPATITQAITPIDHGYWVVPYTGFEDTLQNGWLYIGDINDYKGYLSASSLSKKLTISSPIAVTPPEVKYYDSNFVESSKAYSKLYAAEFSTLEVASTTKVVYESTPVTVYPGSRKLRSADPVEVEFISSDKTVYTSNTTSAEYASKKFSPSTTTRQIELISKDKTLYTSNTIKANYSEKKLHTNNPVSVEFKATEKVLSASDRIKVNKASKKYDASIATKIYKARKKQEPATPTSIGITSSAKRLVASIGYAQTIIADDKRFEPSNTISIVFPNRASSMVTSTRTSLEFKNVEKTYFEPADHVTIIFPEYSRPRTASTPVSINVTTGIKVYEPSGGLPSIFIQASNRRLNSSTTISSRIIGANKQVIASTANSIEFIEVVDKWTTSSAALISLAEAEKKLFPSLPVTFYSGTRRLRSSLPYSIEIYYSNLANVIEEVDWTLIKKLGTEDWKFLSVLDESTTRTLSHISADIKFHEVLAAGLSNDVSYTPFGEIETVVIYRDVNRAQKMSEISVEYVNEFPFRSTLLMYDYYGIKYYDATTTYTQGVDGEVVGDTFTVNLDFVPSEGGLLPCHPSVQVGDAVYIDNSGIVQRGVASSAETSRVTGFVINKPSHDVASMHFRGLLEHTLSGLIPGAQYFLDPVNPGKITNVVPSGTGNVIKKVGIASSSIGLNINLQTQLLILS
jgi:hypothetical protein